MTRRSLGRRRLPGESSNLPSRGRCRRASRPCWRTKSISHVRDYLPGSSTGLSGRDERNAGQTVEAAFLGVLAKEQKTAATALLQHETGVLAATTGFGKTVVAAAMIAARKASTLIFMQCGRVRSRVAAKAQAVARPFLHRVILRATEFVLAPNPDGERPPIQHLYAALAANETRNAMIFDDVLKALEERRSPLILTERKDHALHLADKLCRFARTVIVLTGGMGTKQRRAAMQRLNDVLATDERVLIATGRYVGEGFDDARLDTLVLAMPIAWKGTLAQYVGRLHRSYPTKQTPHVLCERPLP